MAIQKIIKKFFTGLLRQNLQFLLAMTMKLIHVTMLFLYNNNIIMSHLIYFLTLSLLTSGLFIMLTSRNYIHKIIGLGIFQSSVLVFYLSIGKIKTGGVPILQDGLTTYTSPLPHVLMLTAIVVGFATLSVALSLIYQIYKHFGTISENEINFDK